MSDHRAHATTGATTDARPEIETAVRALRLVVEGGDGDGEDDGAIFLLAEGQQLVGSSSSCAVVLGGRSISRRHARLTVRSGTLVVEDLGSKNGTFVDDRRVSACEVPVGSELRFASVALRLDTADPDDGVLALDLLADPGAGPDEPASLLSKGVGRTQLSTLWEPSTGLLRSLPPTLADPSPWRWLDTLLARLAIPSPSEGAPTPSADPDIEAALEDLRQHLAATGVAWVDWRPRSETVVRAHVGKLGALPTLTELRRHHSPRPGARLRLLDGEAPGRAVAACDRAEGASGLVAWCDEAPAVTVPDLLLPLVRILDLAGPRRLDPEPPITPCSLVLPPGMVRCTSPAMETLYRQMEQLLDGEGTILLQGETGVGKEHLARALHDSSPLADGPFVAVNCAAIPAELLEAEMFGIGKGVATGVEARRGRFAEAEGGTLFLDEVGELPLPLQSKLLRVLQERLIQPLGRPAEKLEARLVAATNVALPRQVAEGTFRRDLYYRLAGYVLDVPPLRRRSEDLPLLIGHFLRRACAEARKPLRGLTVKALALLARHPWPGNVRELEHEVRRWVVRCGPNQAVGSDHLSPQVVEPPAVPGAQAPGENPADDRSLDEQLGELERLLLVRALERSAGNQAEAARRLGISRNGLAKRLRRHGIEAKDFRPRAEGA